jgi:rare lipoprotein A
VRFPVSLFLLAIFVMSAFGASPQPARTGLASWYGKRYQGRVTASGERFDMKQLTAAHRSLPFGSKVLVTCPSTGRSVVVRVNDRGPSPRGRIIDLSRAAARELGILGRGLAQVVLIRLPTETASSGQPSAD